MLIYLIKQMVRIKENPFFSLQCFFFLLILDEQIPVDFNPNQACLFCHNRQEYLGNKNSILHHY